MQEEAAGRAGFRKGPFWLTGSCLLTGPSRGPSSVCAETENPWVSLPFSYKDTNPIELGPHS